MTDSRSVAIGGSVIYRHSLSKRSRCHRSHTVPACREKPSIEALNDRWIAAYRAGDYAAIPGLYLEDALVMPLGRPAIDGREALAHALGGLAAGRQVDIGFEILELEIRGDIAWLVSRFRVSYTPPDAGTGANGEAAAKSHTEYGRPLIIYRKDANGQ